MLKAFLYRSLKIEVTVATLAFMLSTSASGKDPLMEAPIIHGAITLKDEGRYRLRHSYEDAVAYYQRKFKRTRGIRWHTIVHHPGIKAKHIECRRKNTLWEGINIYDIRGEVRLFVIPRSVKPVLSRPSPKSASNLNSKNGPRRFP